jgi:hypothetical protein
MSIYCRTQPATRNSRRLEFNKKGKYEEIANRQRAKAKLESLQREISQIAKRTGIAVGDKVTIIQPKKFFVCHRYNSSCVCSMSVNVAFRTV